MQVHSPIKAATFLPIKVLVSMVGDERFIPDANKISPKVERG